MRCRAKEAVHLSEEPSYENVIRCRAVRKGQVHAPNADLSEGRRFVVGFVQADEHRHPCLPQVRDESPWVAIVLLSRAVMIEMLHIGHWIGGMIWMMEAACCPPLSCGRDPIETNARRVDGAAHRHNLAWNDPIDIRLLV